MSDAVATLRRLRRLAHPVRRNVSRVDEALPAVRALLTAGAVRYRIVGGIAVVHHGYERFTHDIDVLLDPESSSGLDGVLEAHGFTRLSPARLRHDATGVEIDLLSCGAPTARPPHRPYPAWSELGASADAADIVDLKTLFALKLAAARHQDEADMVALLKRLGEGEYLAIEAAVDRALRPRLAALRADALEELRWQS